MSGITNVRAVLKYLRGIGVEVSPEVASAWREQEKRHRLRGRTVEACREYTCSLCGRVWRLTRARFDVRAKRCPDCGQGASQWACVWARKGDGTVRRFFA